MLIPVKEMPLKSGMFCSVLFNPLRFHCFLILNLLFLPSSGIYGFFLIPFSLRLMFLTGLLSHKHRLTWVYVSLDTFSSFIFLFSQVFKHCSFSFAAPQPICLCTFNNIAWLCPPSQSNNVTCHLLHAQFVILSSWKKWSKSCQSP